MGVALRNCEEGRKKCVRSMQRVSNEDADI